MLNELSVCIAGSPDFLRRFSPVELPNGKLTAVNLAESRSHVLAEKPHLLVFDIGVKTTRDDLQWLRQLLATFRERLGNNIRIVAAAMAPEKFLSTGDLLFRDGSGLAASGFLDDLIIVPPAGVIAAPAPEAQLRDAFSYLEESLRAQIPPLNDPYWVPSMCDPQSRMIWLRWLPRYAQYVNENPIIVGPTGSGKTRLAAALHCLSRREGPFITITPRDFSSSELIQAELFGAVAGAYTGAVDRWGLVKKAEKGTLFIDELQSIDLDLQGKLITFIENKSYRRVGDAESHRADVRFVFATNRPLQELVSAGKLRDDFAYRLERLQVSLRPLAERRLDIAAGLCLALAKIRRERQMAAHSVVEGFTPGAYQRLFYGTWPGNLRQLENTTSQLLEFADMRGLRLIDEQCVTEATKNLLGEHHQLNTGLLEKAVGEILNRVRRGAVATLPDVSRELVENALTSAVAECEGDLERAAELLGESKSVLDLFVKGRQP